MKLVSSVLPEVRCTTSVTFASPTLSRFPATYQPPLPSLALSETVPTSEGHADSGSAPCEP